MKFDPHRAKASRRWKARHQSEGAKNTPSSTSSVDSTATHDNDLDHDSGSDSETRRFGRRKLESNAFRFVDEKIDDNDATVSDSATMAENDSKRADRETRNLIALIRDAERELIVDPSSYFRFKGEQDWTLDSKASLQADLLSEDVSKLWALDFAGLDEALATLPLSDRFALAENELVYADDGFLLRSVPLSTRLSSYNPAYKSKTTVKSAPLISTAPSERALPVYAQPPARSTKDAKALGEKFSLADQAQPSSSTNSRTSAKKPQKPEPNEVDDFLTSDPTPRQKPSGPSRAGFTRPAARSSLRQPAPQAGEEDDLKFLDDILGSG